jgi:hypothetical protein
MNVNEYIIELKNRNKTEIVYQVPIKEITDRFPILNELWTHYKGMCNFGTESKIQTLALNGVIEKIPYLSKMRDEVMSYPDKQKYDKFEQNEMYENILQQPVVIPFNDVWRLKNGKYQHLINNLCFPRYHWDTDKLESLHNIGLEPRGNFYYPPGGFREWHSNRTHGKGFRMYFIACEKDGKSGLNYLDNRDNKVKTLFDKNEHANIFYVNDNKDEAFFHSIFSDTDRFSLGFNIN